MWRSCEPGHLTASALVLSADRSATLLTLHPRVGQWLQLGGHCEPGDPTLLAAALREATEESGIEGLEIDPVPVRLDVHAPDLLAGHGRPGTSTSSTGRTHRTARSPGSPPSPTTSPGTRWTPCRARPIGPYGSSSRRR